MQLNTQSPAYDLTGGDETFNAVQINGNLAAVQVSYSDIAVDDVTAELHQSIDGTNFDVVIGSSVTIDKTKPTHTWNISGVTPGLFLRVKVYQGSASAGTIDKIKTLS
jgi:hypothetical protein